MNVRVRLFVLILLSLSLRCESWGWFSSSKESHSRDKSCGNKASFRGSNAEFSIEAFNDPNGMKLIENAKNKIRSRLAWHLSDCFQKDSGRASFPLL